MNKILLSVLTLFISILPSFAAELSIATGAVGDNVKSLRARLDLFEKETGNKVKIVNMPASTTEMFAQYKLWLSAKNSDIDLYMTDIIWAPQIGHHLVDLKPYAKDVIGEHFTAIIESQIHNGRLVALPLFTAAPALFYRNDLLKKYRVAVPKTWQELRTTAQLILSKEKNKKLQGFVWQGNAYEGLTCNALEWVKSFGGGQIVEEDGTISINNKNAILALETAKSWVGDISPRGVLSYQEEESRGIWQSGNAIFMRNWPYAYNLSNSDNSAVKGKFDVITLPVGKKGMSSAATLGGWNIAVSKYSKNIDQGVALAKFLTSKAMQKDQALKNSYLPTIKALYKDREIIEKIPFISKWFDVLMHAIPRPSFTTKRKYNEMSKEFYTAVHNTLSGNGSAENNLKLLEKKLKRLKRKSW